MDNGMSKKLCITIISIQAVIGLSDGSDEKMPYAVIICIIFGIYKGIQAFLDWSSRK